MKKKLYLPLLTLLLLLSGCSDRNGAPAVTETPVEEAVTVEEPRSSIVLSLLVADNRTLYPGESGLFPDFLSLRNEGSEPEDIGGYYLSQKEGRLHYALPALTLSPGEELTIDCDGWGKELHADFSLKSEGEQVVLSNSEGRTLWALEYPALGEDEAYVRNPDGSYGIESRGAAAAQRPAGLSINECASFNFSFNGISNNYYDWVELYNGSAETILLSDYTLSDKRESEGAPRLPERRLESGSYCVILLTGSETPRSALPIHPISLDGQRDALYLRTAEGELLDYCSLHDIPLGGSYGRDRENWVYYTSPSPGEDNGSGYAEVSGSVSVDTSEGCYEGIDSLTVKLSGPGELRYTLDGSEPDESSALYTSPLTLSETTVLRARAYEEGKAPGRISGYSYLLNEGHSLPVVSLIVDPVAFFESSADGYPGIYYLNANTIEPETLTDVSFFAEGEEGFHAQSNVCLHGASTRHSRVKKSLKLSFRGAYSGDVQYDLFGDGVERYHSLCLRSGYMSDNTLLRDSVCQSTAIACGAKVLTLRNRYCVLYINGEYWGIYSLREAYSKAYAADHLGSTEEEVQIARSPVRSWFDSSLVKLMDYVSFHRSWTEKDYAYVASVIDLESLADWMILESYFYNYDLPGNIRYIRANSESKWMYAFFDLDFGLRKDEMSWMYTCDDGNQFGLITHAIIKKPEFREILLTRMAALYEQGLSEQTAQRYLDEYAEQLIPELDREYDRWCDGSAYTESAVESLRALITDNRQSRCLHGLCKWVHLNEEEILSQYFSGMELE